MNHIRRSSAALVGAALLLVSAVALEAHDFWLIPNAFRIGTDTPIEIRGQTSSRFPTSESAVAVERVADARIFSATDEATIRDLSTSGTSLLVRHRPSSAGQRLVAVTLHPSSVRESAEGFRNYLVVEGAPEALERYAREGKLPTDSISRRYAKYAKTLVEVGTGGPRAFSRIAGHPAELVPLLDPAGLSPGDTLPVQLLFQGRPLPAAKLHAGSVAGVERNEEERAVLVVTDADGVARVPIGRGGVWNVRGLHIVPSDAGSGADWDTHWVTLVFQVDGARSGGSNVESPSGSPSSSDSAAVATVVHRFHDALESADSATALGLLTDDAIILESGGRETKQEYRSHHLPGDIAFARAVARDSGPLRVEVRGDVAWATSTSEVRGTYRDRQVASRGAELMVLVRDEQQWRISAIHWSSRAIQQ